MAGPVPAIPTLRGAALTMIGITGTRPVMTVEGRVLPEKERPSRRVVFTHVSSRGAVATVGATSEATRHKLSR